MSDQTERTFTTTQTDPELQGLDVIWQVLLGFDYATQTRMMRAVFRRVADERLNIRALVERLEAEAKRACKLSDDGFVNEHWDDLDTHVSALSDMSRAFSQAAAALTALAAENARLREALTTIANFRLVSTADYNAAEMQGYARAAPEPSHE